MGVVSCPVTTVRAPLEVVWGLLAEPEAYESWADAELVSADPPGPLHAGQVLEMRTSGFGRSWPVRFDVVEADAAKHRIALDVHLPLGVVNHEVITCRAVSEDRTWVGFN
jgi:hypothetical protein